MRKFSWLILLICLVFVTINQGWAAFSSVKSSRDVMGAGYVEVYTLNFASVTTGTITTGMKRIRYASFQNSTTATAGAIVSINSATASETEDDDGQVTISGVVSSDLGELWVWGI